MFDLRYEIMEYLKYCEKQKKLSSHTLKAYKIDLRQYCEFKNGIGIEKGDIAEYVQHLHECYKPKTVRRKIAALKAFVRYLYYYDIIDYNPFDKVDTAFREPLTLPRTIPEKTIKNLIVTSYDNIENAKTEYQKQIEIRNTAKFELLFATGARISEICSLKTYNINLVTQTVRIFGKGSKERIIQIENEEVLAILKLYKSTFGEYIQPDGFFFLNNRKQRFSEQSVRIVLLRLEKQIGSEIHITPHMFRHSVATMLLEEDVDIRYIQKILGHSSITTTQIYTHVTSSKQKEILRTKHPRNKFHI